MPIGLLTPSIGYKPFHYPWAYQYWKAQQRVHWLPEEVKNLGDDVKDWRKLPEHEKNLLTQIFRFFVQADMDVNDNYMQRYSSLFKPNEIRMMLSAFSNIETVHIDAYALLIETVGMPELEYQAFMDYSQMREKHEYMNAFNVDTPKDTLKTLAGFGAFTEGLQLFASFAMLLNFQRFKKMRGMGQIVTWSVRDESLHCEAMIRLFHAWAQETGCYDGNAKAEIIDICNDIVKLEDNFIDLAFALGPVEGMTAEDTKAYVRYVAEWRLRQLKAIPQDSYGLLGGTKQHPLPWLSIMLNGIEHANFFETTATEYSKVSTQGSWTEVWEHFDSLKQA